MDCYSPGQVLMPASFKVRTVPLDNDESVTEEVLDPDFGEAAIGRVAPVDSGNHIPDCRVFEWKIHTCNFSILVSLTIMS